ncbi:MAG: hypothetical protein ABRQ23_00290 [Syntrophomonadaceae bacterium]
MLVYIDEKNSPALTCYDRRQVESVKRALARCYAIDLQAQAKILRSSYGRYLLHFFLPDGRVFIPFKLRENRIKGDARYGYINLNQITRLLPGNPPAIMLHAGSRLTVYSDIDSARLAWFMGMEIQSDYFPYLEEPDHDLVNALAILRSLLNGQFSLVSSSIVRPASKIFSTRN